MLRGLDERMEWAEWCPLAGPAKGHTTEQVWHGIFKKPIQLVNQSEAQDALRANLPLHRMSFVK